MTCKQLAKKYPGIGEKNIRAWMLKEQDNLPYVQTGRGLLADEEDFIKYINNEKKVRR